MTRKCENILGLIFQRSEIINAIYEPTEEECEWKADVEEEISVSILIGSHQYLKLWHETKFNTVTKVEKHFGCIMITC